jgi:hypothetical protein
MSLPKQLLISTGLTLLLTTELAGAAFVMTIDDLSTQNSVDRTITDNQTGDQSSLLGSIVYNGSVNAFDVIVSTGTSKPLITGNPQFLDLNSVQISGATGDLVISLTDTDYTGSPLALTSLFGGTVLGSADFDFYLDENNTEFGMTTHLFSSSGNIDDFSGRSTTGLPSLTSPYSLTIVANIHHSSTSVSSFDAEIRTAPIPLPAAGWLLGTGLVGLLGWGRRSSPNK